MQIPHITLPPNNHQKHTATLLNASSALTVSPSNVQKHLVVASTTLFSVLKMHFLHDPFNQTQRRCCNRSRPTLVRNFHFSSAKYIHAASNSTFCNRKFEQFVGASYLVARQRLHCKGPLIYYVWSWQLCPPCCAESCMEQSRTAGSHRTLDMKNLWSPYCLNNA